MALLLAATLAFAPQSAELHLVERAPLTSDSAVMASLGTVLTGFSLMITSPLMFGQMYPSAPVLLASNFAGLALVNFGPSMGDLLIGLGGRFLERGLLRLGLLALSVASLLIGPVGAIATVLGTLGWLVWLAYDTIDSVNAPRRWAERAARAGPPQLQISF